MADTVEFMRTVAQQSERRSQQVACLLDSDDELIGTFVAMDGNGAAAVAATWFAGLLGGLLVSTARPTKSYTVAVTRSSILLVRNNAFGRSKAVEHRYPRIGTFGPVEGTMDCTLNIRGERYIVPFFCAPEAWKLVQSCNDRD